MDTGQVADAPFSIRYSSLVFTQIKRQSSINGDSFTVKLKVTYPYLHEVRGVLHPPDGLHERVPDHDLDVRAGVVVRQLSQPLEVAVVQRGLGVAQVETEHVGAGGGLGEADVDALFETPIQ